MRHLLLALSLANLLFLRAWDKILAGGGNYLNDFKPDAAAVAFWVLLTGGVLWVGWRLGRSVSRLAVAGKLLFLLLLLIPANATYLYYRYAFMPVHGRRYEWILWLVLAVHLMLLGYAAYARRLRLQLLVRYGIAIILALAPFMLFTFGMVLREGYRAVFSDQEQALAAEPGTNAMPLDEGNNGVQAGTERIVWLIFDELEERVAFQERPASVAMPELDRLQDQAFVASSAYPPAPKTLQSIPALLNGALIAAAKAHNETTLILRQEGEERAVPWRHEATLFAETAAAGLETALVGIYHPYCQILGDTIQDCRDLRDELDDRTGFGSHAGRALLQGIEAVPGLYRPLETATQIRKHLVRYRFALREGKRVVANPRFDLVYIHLPVPHPPGIYDRMSGRLTNSSHSSYLDNLALTDHAFGALRRAMEAAGVWERSTVIVTADHWWRSDFWATQADWTTEEQQAAGGRSPDQRVPFMVKFPGDGYSLVYDRPFNTVITRQMIMAILTGRLRSGAELARWLDTHAIGTINPAWNTHAEKRPPYIGAH
jgi:hypothetical protein